MLLGAPVGALVAVVLGLNDSRGRGAEGDDR